MTEETLDIPRDTLGLHPLYPPKSKSDVTSTVDIVAVHGLGGDSFSTWRHKGTKKLWLRDFLPTSEIAKDARVMTFGYDARAFTHPFSENSTGRSFTFAEALLNDLSDARSGKRKNRPIIFIGHSLGGIVIKKALVYAHARSDLYGDILNSVQSIVFFGTPHQGSGAATWGSFFTRLSKGLGIHSANVLRELETWSHPLVELTTSFAQLAPKYEITTFFEEKDTHGVRVVPEGSARLGQNRERIRGLAADHLQICKFASADDANYKIVEKRLEAIIESISIPEGIPSAIPEEAELSDRLRNLRAPPAKEL